MNIKGLMIVLTTITSISCAQQTPTIPAHSEGSVPKVSDDTVLRYERSTEDGWEGTNFVFSLCTLAAPEDSVVLVEAMAPFTYHPTDCSEDGRFGVPRFATSVRLVAHAGGPATPSEFIINTPSGSFEELEFSEAGSLLLTAVRESRGDWFMTNFVYVVTNEADGAARDLDPATTFDIPETWAGVTQRTKQILADYDNQCVDSRRVSKTDEEIAAEWFTFEEGQCPGGVVDSSDPPPSGGQTDE